MSVPTNFQVSAVPSHKSQLRWRELVADGTMAFEFAKPPGFIHQAGQSILLTLPDPPETDSTGNSRTFTIASAPYEPELLIATRLRDTAFKRVLQSMPIGTPVRLEGPTGEMVLNDDDARPVVLLAGGIGITPFLAMVRHATQAELPHQISLFYANRRPEDAAFLAELTEMTTVNPNFHLIATMSQATKSARRGQAKMARSIACYSPAICPTSTSHSIILPGHRP
jgi:ferredoxin-NADP reductase